MAGSLKTLLQGTARRARLSRSSRRRCRQTRPSRPSSSMGSLDGVSNRRIWSACDRTEEGAEQVF